MVLEKSGDELRVQSVEVYMTDFEITKLCAEAMGLDYTVLAETVRLNPYHNTEYLPLHDDAQAMSLVKKFPQRGLLAISKVVDGQTADLNRAICECVAKAQAKK